MRSSVSVQFFFRHTSFTSPGDIYRFEVSKEKELSATEPTVFRRSAFKGMDLTAFKTEQVFYESKDGTRVPMFLISKKDLVKSEQTPTILYAYGGFNISLTPTFSVTRLIWLQHFNGVYAIANIRGGGLVVFYFYLYINLYIITNFGYKEFLAKIKIFYKVLNYYNQNANYYNLAAYNYNALRN